MADTAARTVNPIRSIVETIKMPQDKSKELIPLSIGDPTVFGNFKTPKLFVDKIVEALQNYSCNGYLHSAGSVECREAIAKRYSTLESPLTADDVVVAGGCSAALDLAISALCNPGTNIVVPKPGFPLYETLSASKGVEVRFYGLIAEKGWEADLAELESLVDSNTSAILVNNPSNPCGSVYSKKHLEDILAIAERKRVPVIADEIYGNLVFTGEEFFPMGSLSTTVPVVSTGGIAKEFLVPGWRVGWVIVHDKSGVLGEIRKGLFKLSQLILGATSIVQAALPAILAPEAGSSDEKALEEFHRETVEQLETNARFTVDRMSTIPGIRVVKPQGAMYVMIGIDPSRFRDIGDDVEFTQKLLTEESVFLLPGQAFKMVNFARIVFSPPLEKLSIAYDRIEAFCKRHSSLEGSSTSEL